MYPGDSHTPNVKSSILLDKVYRHVRVTFDPSLTPVVSSGWEIQRFSKTRRKILTMLKVVFFLDLFECKSGIEFHFLQEKLFSKNDFILFTLSLVLKRNSDISSSLGKKERGVPCFFLIYHILWSKYFAQNSENFVYITKWKNTSTLICSSSISTACSLL